MVAFLLCFSFVVNVHCVLLLARYREIYQEPPVWVREDGQSVNSYQTPLQSDARTEESVDVKNTELPSDETEEEGTETNLTQDKTGITVYLTKSGSKFHREGCSSLSKSKIPISYEDAIARGFSPCGRCNP